MLWWDRVAPFGKPVVPDVYWMLIGSSGLNAAWSRASSARSPPRPSAITSSQFGLPMRSTCRSAGQFGRTSLIIAS
jgi:hypothetical protein